MTQFILCTCVYNPVYVVYLCWWPSLCSSYVFMTLCTCYLPPRLCRVLVLTSQFVPLVDRTSVRRVRRSNRRSLTPTGGRRSWWRYNINQLNNEIVVYLLCSREVDEFKYLRNVFKCVSIVIVLYDWRKHHFLDVLLPVRLAKYLFLLASKDIL